MQSKPSVAELVQHYRLEPHPEGGFFRENYRSPGKFGALPLPYLGDRHYSTAIYFLLPAGSRSRLHRIASDEVWHFYLGGPMTLIQISPNGNCDTITLGSDVLRGQKLQHVVPAGYWFGGYAAEGVDYSFLGCTVAPGFDFADFEMAERSQLLALFPQHREMIERLTG